MSKLHKALSESPNVLTAKELRDIRSTAILTVTRVDRRNKTAVLQLSSEKQAREYIEELARSLKLAKASKKKRKGAK